MTDRAANGLQALGRLLLSAIFLIFGYAKLTAPTATIAMMAHAGAPMPQVAFVVGVIIELGGGLLILFGLFTRPAAAVVGLWCIATALVAHSNWADVNMQIHFWKNVAMAGGFAYVVAFGAGAYSLDAVLFRHRLSPNY